MHRLATACLAILLGSVGAAQQPAPPANGVTPGELIVDPPTLINLGFEWLIDGDANRNAKVDVSYRKVGDTAWKTGMPLLRLQGERVTQPNVFDLVSPNMFAGSILDLEPDTAYEARFVLSDPDGVSGPAANATKTVTVRTRPEPKPAEGGKVYHVYPVGYTGAKTEPAFTGIMCAYNYYCGAGDTAPGGRPRVKPGDTILVHAGTYAYRYELYANQTTINATTTFEGTYYLTADGTPERPIVIKAAGDGEVIIDGRGNFNLFNVKAADYNYFEGHHVQEHRHRDLGGHAVHRRLEGADGQALPVRTGRHGRVLELLGLEQLLHRRQRVPRPERLQAPDRMERRVLGTVQRRRGAGRSRRSWRRTPRSGSTAPATSSPTTTSRTFTTASTPRCTACPTARMRTTARRIRRASSGIGGRCRSTSTTTTSPTRTTTRSRWTAACTTSA